MAIHRSGLLLSLAALVSAIGLPVRAQDATAPPAIAGYAHEPVAPGVWRILDDGTNAPLDEAWQVLVGRHGTVWLLTPEGAFKLGVGALGPTERAVDRLLAVGSRGEAWLRFRGSDQEGIGTWDGDMWIEITGPRRSSALEADPGGAPGVVRDFALGPDGTVWVVAGEQDGPRWERFTVERLDEDGWTSWAIGEGLPELRCDKNCGDRSRVLALDDGTVWVSIDQGGLLRFDGETWEAIRPVEDEDLPVSALVGDPGGTVWADLELASGERARARSEGAGWRIPASAGPEPASRIDDEPVATSPDGTLWAIGDDEEGCPVLWAQDERERRPVTLPGCGPVLSLSVGPDGLVWLIVGIDRQGTSEGGASLLVVDPATALD